MLLNVPFALNYSAVYWKMFSFIKKYDKKMQNMSLYFDLLKNKKYNFIIKTVSYLVV